MHGPHRAPKRPSVTWAPRFTASNSEILLCHHTCQTQGSCTATESVLLDRDRVGLIQSGAGDRLWIAMPEHQCYAPGHVTGSPAPEAALSLAPHGLLCCLMPRSTTAVYRPHKPQVEPRCRQVRLILVSALIRTAPASLPMTDSTVLLPG